MMVSIMYAAARRDDEALQEAREWVEARSRVRCDIREAEDFDGTFTVEFEFDDELDARDFLEAGSIPRRWLKRVR